MKNARVLFLVVAIGLTAFVSSPSKAFAGWGWWGGPGISIAIGPRYPYYGYGYRPYGYGYYGRPYYGYRGYGYRHYGYGYRPYWRGHARRHWRRHH